MKSSAHAELLPDAACAPLAHKTVGTDKTGTVRISFSPFTQRRQVIHACTVIEKIANGEI